MASSARRSTIRPSPSLKARTSVPGGDTRFREQTDGELDQTLVVDTEFCRFPKHGTSVAPSHS